MKLNGLERKEKEFIVKLSSISAREILNKVPFGVIIVGMDKKIRFLNKAALDFMKLNSEDEVLGKICHGHICPFETNKCPIIDLGEELNYSEKEIIGSDRIPIPILKTVIPFSLLGEEFLLEAFIDISERKRLEEQLKKSEKDYRAIFDSSLDYMYITDINGNFIDVNQALLDRVGLTLQEMRHKNFIDFFAGDNPEELMEVVKRVQKGERVEGVEARAKNVRGEIFYAEVNVVPIFKDNKVIRVLNVARDITEQLLMRQQIKSSEEELRRIIDNLDVGFYRAEPNGKILKNNPTLNKILGVDPSKNLIGTNVIEFWQDPSEREKYLEELLKNGFVRNYVSHSKTRDGKKIILNVNSHVVRKGDNQPIYIEGTISDITEKFNLEQKLKESRENLRKLNEELEQRIDERTEELRKSEEKYKTLVETMRDGLGILNKDNILTFVNPSMCEMIGYSIEEIIGHDVFEFLDDRNTKILEEQLARRRRKKTEVYEIEWIRKDGTLLPTLLSPQPIFDENDNVVGSFAVITDITLLKEVERKLKESEYMFRTLSDQALMGIVLIQDGIFKYVNKAGSKITGYSIEEVMNWGPEEFANIIHPEDRQFALEQARKKQRGDSDIVPHYSYRIITKSGEMKWIENYSRTVEYEGRPADLVTVIDITERHRTEELLRDSEEKYRTLVEEIQDGVFLIRDRKVEFINESFAKIVGYSVEEIIGMDIRQLIAPEDLDLVVDRYYRRQAGEEVPKEYEFRLLHKDGKTKIPVNMSVGLIHYHGKVASIGTIKDITERKQAEKLLRESEEKYRLITENANDLISVIGKGIKYEFINERAFLNILGYSSEDLIGKNAFKLVHPDDQNYVASLFFNQALLSRTPIESRYRHKDGHYIWVESKGNIMETENKGKKAIVISRDITKRKLLEQELKESETRYRNAYLRAEFYKDLLSHDMGNILQ
ncbi:MAG: PAS domain S-box protein, partial [Candidatus Helarchaeota archaeon]